MVYLVGLGLFLKDLFLEHLVIDELNNSLLVLKMIQIKV